MCDQTLLSFCVHFQLINHHPLPHSFNILFRCTDPVVFTCEVIRFESKVQLTILCISLFIRQVGLDYVNQITSVDGEEQRPYARLPQKDGMVGVYFLRDVYLSTNPR